MFIIVCVLWCCGTSRGAETPRLLTTVKPLPMALSDDFEFRKTTLYFLSEHGKRSPGGRTRSTRPSTVQPTYALNFERQYRLHGAVTKLDQRQRAGHYFTFFWRSKRPSDVTVRFEYRQDKLRSFVQGQEISYANARGNTRTEFKVIGDDYFDDGRVISWRCLVIEGGRIVAEHRSYLWE